MVEQFREYVLNNHHVSREPPSVLQAFLISLVRTFFFLYFPAVRSLIYLWHNSYTLWLKHNKSVTTVKRCFTMFMSFWIMVVEFEDILKHNKSVTTFYLNWGWDLSYLIILKMKSMLGEEYLDMLLFLLVLYYFLYYVSIAWFGQPFSPRKWH
jgi:hypothetical protein